MLARRRMQGRARARVLAAGAAVALAAAVLTSGGAASAARPGAQNQNWVPPTPAYWPQVVGERATRPVTITHGVQEYTENYQTVGGAQDAQIMDVNLADPNVRFGMAEAGSELVDPADETISSMAHR